MGGWGRRERSGGRSAPPPLATEQRGADLVEGGTLPASAFVIDFLVSTGMVQASFLLLGVLLPLDEFGALRVAFVSLSPLANLLAGVRALTLAHLAGLRRAPARARRRAAQLATSFAAAGLAYGTILVVLPDRLGAEVFGDTWSDAAGLVGIVAVGEALRLSTFAAIDLVKVLGAPSVLYAPGP